MQDPYINMRLNDPRLVRIDEREVFEVELVGENEPMSSDNFYVWLNNKPRRENYKIGAIKEYLASLGFDARSHKVSPKTLKILGYIFSSYWDMWSPIKEPIDLASLLMAVRERDRAGAFYLNFSPDTPNSPSYVVGTKKLWDIFRHPDFSNTWHITPEDYYLTVSHNCLWLKGQSVITSTHICELTQGSCEEFANQTFSGVL